MTTVEEMLEGNLFCLKNHVSFSASSAELAAGGIERSVLIFP
jgi:hypothetical protein